MEKIDLYEIIYSVCLEDIQTVAEEEIERELTFEEIKNIKELVVEKIAERSDWYGAIAEAISEKITGEEDSDSEKG